MRGGGTFAGAGPADFRHDNRLANLRGAAGRGEKFIDIANAFDEQQDHIGRSILHHVFEKFAGAQIRLVAGADDIRERDADRLGTVIDRKADAAALRDDADPPDGRDQRPFIGFYIDGRAECRGDALDLAIKSLRIRAGNPHAGLFRERRNRVLHRGAVAALLRESRGDDHRVLDANGCTLFERAEDGAGGNDDDRKVDRLPDVSDRGKAFQPVDIAVIRIDRIEFSGKSVLAQHRQQPTRNFLQIARGADQRDAVGRKEGVERMRHSERSFSCRHCEPTGRRGAPPDDRLREAIHIAATKEAGLLRRGACHRARIRATRWLAMTDRDT